MRWFWIDRFVEFVSGSHAAAIKNVTMAEDCLYDNHMESSLGSSLILEGMAQTGGMLVGESTNYEARLVLGKVSRLTLHDVARPADTLRYDVKIESFSPEGAMLSGTSKIGDQLQAEAEFFLAILAPDQGKELFEPAELARLLRMLRVFDVGVNQEGEPLGVPEFFLESERQAAALPDVGE